MISRKRISIKDWVLRALIFIMLAVWLYGIPPISGIFPISPMYFMPALLTIILSKQLLSKLPSLLKRVEFLIFISIIMVVMLIDIFYGGFTIEKMLFQFCAILFEVIVLTYSIKSSSNKKFVVISTGILLAISALWFLAEISIKNPFIKWRLLIYGALYTKPGIDYTLTRCGLVSALHLLGYQISVLAPILLVALFTIKRFELKGVLYVLGLVCSLCAVWFSSQRSTVLAILACMLFLIIKAPQLFFRSRILFRFAIVVLVALFFTTYQFWDRVNLQNDLVVKFQKTTIENDSRLMLQKSAFGLILEYPLGLKAANISWIKANENKNIYADIAVHNGYLGIGLQGGIIVILLEIAFLWQIARVFVKKIKYVANRCSNELEKDRLMFYAASISCFLIQPMFHNSGLFVFDGSSLVCFALYLVARYPVKTNFLNRCTGFNR